MHDIVQVKMTKPIPKNIAGLIDKLTDLYELEDLLNAVEVVKDAGQDPMGFMRYLNHYATEDREQLGIKQPIQNYLGLYFLYSEKRKI